MRRITTLFLMALAAMLALAPVASADGVNYTGFLMLEEPVNPRSAAMGSAGTALVSGGFRYYNPAQPFFSGHSSAAAEFGQMPGGLNRGGFESALVLPEWFAAISFHSSSVDFETRDERGFGALTSSSTTVGAIGAGYIRGNLAAAVSLNMVEDRIWVSSTYSAAALSAGLGYKTLDGKLNLGAAGLHSIAWSKGFGDEKDTAVWHSGRVPVFARAGAAWMDTLRSFPYTVAADVVYSKEDETFTVPVGIEVSVLPYINVRLGKRIGWDDEIMSLGLGFNIDRISFDAAFIPTVFVDEYEIKWSMGFTYRMGAKRKQKAAQEPVAEPEPDIVESAEEPAEPEPEVIEPAEEPESTEQPGEDNAEAPAEPSEEDESTEEPTEDNNPAESPAEPEVTESPEEDKPESPAEEDNPAESAD